jgi:hypothetical protein
MEAWSINEDTDNVPSSECYESYLNINMYQNKIRIELHGSADFTFPTITLTCIECFFRLM